MKHCIVKSVWISLFLFGVTICSAAQKIKVIVDQDARGPGTSDQQTKARPFPADAATFAGSGGS